MLGMTLWRDGARNVGGMGMGLFSDGHGRSAILVLSALALLGSSLVMAPAAQASSQVYNPCQRLSDGQTKFSGYGANRVTFATATDRNSDVLTITACVRSGSGYVQEWQDWGYGGINGFAAQNQEWEDTYRSPTGSFSFTEALGRSNPGTALSYHTINYWSRWGGERGANYNQYFEGAGGPADENLYDNMNLGYYEQAAVINYNRQPDSAVVQGASFAIFFHAGRVPSAGCISTSLSTVNRLLQTNRPGDRIVMGAVDDVFTPYSSNPFGAITQKYASIGGPASGLGSPNGNETGGLKDGGAYQSFQGGAIVWSPSYGARVSVGSIRNEWASTGFENGVLGYPTSDEAGGLKNGGVYQMYQSGAIVWSPASGAHASTGAIRSKWQSAGFENGKLGYATSDEVGGLKNAGVYQMYQGGAIVWTPATGPHISTGYIRTLYGNAGFENGVLGYPTSDEYPIGGSGVAQDYQGGVIVVSNSGGYIVSGAIGAEYKNNPAMGYPTSSEAGIKDGGKYQLFQSGAVIWSPTTGAHASLGGTRAAWASTGFENGTLGYPTTDEVPVPGGVYQKYQGGVIYWSPSTSGKFMTTDYQAKFDGSNGLSVLGFPNSNRVTGIKDGGQYQSFQNGAIVSAPAVGIRLSVGATRAAWAGTGFESGKLGYPTTDNYTSADGSTVQDYQNGRIIVSTTKVTTITYGTGLPPVS